MAISINALLHNVKMFYTVKLLQNVHGLWVKCGKASLQSMAGITKCSRTHEMYDVILNMCC